MTTPPAERPDLLGRTRLFWIVLLLLLAFSPAFILGDHRKTGSRELSPPADLLQHGIRLAAGPASPLDSDVLFTLGMVVDELILLLGVWLLARSLFADPRTWFFVSVAALGSSLSLGQAASPFRSFHALPLLLHFARQFRATRSPTALLAGLNLAGLQALGKPASQALLTPLAALLILSVFRRFLEFRHGVRDPRANPRTLGIAGAVGLISWIPVAATILSAPSAGGSPVSGSSSFPLDLLALSGLDNPGCLLDLVVGIAAVPDFTVYAGFLTLGFALYAFICAGLRPSLRLLGEGLSILLLLGLVSAIALRVAPGTSGLRPGAVGAPLWRLLLAFLAGTGLQHALQHRPAPRAAIPLIAGGLLTLGGFLLIESAGIPSTLDLKGRAAACFVPRSPAALSPIFDDRTTVRELLDTSALWALVAGGLFCLAGSGRRRLPLAIALLLLLHPLDVFGWRMRCSWILTQERFHSAGVLAAPFGVPVDDRSKPGVATVLLGVNALLWIAGMTIAAGRLAFRRYEWDHADGSRAAG